MHWYERGLGSTAEVSKWACDKCGEEVKESDIRRDDLGRELCGECYEEMHGDE